MSQIDPIRYSTFAAALATKQLTYRRVGNREPRSAEVKAKIAATQRLTSSWHNDEQRQAHCEALALRKVRYIMNVVRREGECQIFDMVGIRVVLPADAPPVEMLLAIMRHPDAPLVLRQDCAKNAAVFVHQRVNNRVKVEHVNAP
jgi:hypothetical protein